MASIELNSIVAAIRGKIGKSLVMRKMRDGRIILSGTPDFSRRKFSKGQLTHQSRFQEAVAYARHAAKTQPIYAQLAEGTTKTAYNIALSDWFNPPVIHNIKQQGGCIRIEADDNVLVAKVIVTVLDADGKISEKREAILVKGLWWEYIPVTEGKVIVEACDLSGNITKREM